MNYRVTTHTEREALRLRGCYAESWESVEVSEDFRVEQLRNVRFEGSVRIGSNSRIADSTIANYHIGDNCTIYQGATLGGTGKDVGKRHPTIGNNVMISAGAKVLGPFKIGDNSRVAAGAVVLEEVPPNSTVVGVPARVVRQDGKKVTEPLDQIHIPDPVAQELKRLESKLSELQAELDKLKK